MISEKYDVSKIEAKWQERWKAERIYAWNPSEPREACYIVAAATSLAQLSQLGEKTE
jgi:leucyl-tRNA synthetase